MYRPRSLRIKNIISFKDVLYEFRVGEAVIITGVNNDNPSQRSNGVGKSGLIESLALAFTGTSIRKVRVKELVNDESTEGEVDLILDNPATKKPLRIWRKIYTNTKSGECRIWLGDEEIRLSDINEYNKWIFEEIGLSKDDFFNFFLITSDNYSPFLNVSDTKKKEIINRFSGADSIDAVFPFIKADVEKLEAERVELDKSKTASQTRAQIYADQLEDLKSTLTPEAIEIRLQNQKELISKKTLEISKFAKESELAEEELDKLRRELEIASLDVDTFDIKGHIKTITEEMEAEEEKKLVLQASKAKLSKDHFNVQLSFKSSVDQVKEAERQANIDLTLAKEGLKEFEDFESEVSKKLEDSIECPNCHHMFSLRDEEFNVTEAKALLPSILEEIRLSKEVISSLNTKLYTDIPTQKNKINSDILKAQQSIKAEIEEVDVKIKAIDEVLDQLSALEKEVKEKHKSLISVVTNTTTFIANKEKQVKYNEVRRKQLEEELVVLKGRLEDIKDESGQKEIGELNEKIKVALEEEKKIDGQLEKYEKKIMSTKSWETNFKNFKSYVANQSIKNIQDYTNLFLQSMKTDIGIEIDGYKTLASNKIKEAITATVLRDGFDAGSYGKFSGGERGRIDVAVILSIQELINLNCPQGKGLDLLICDEILDQIDTLGLEFIIEALQGIGKTIAIISQNEINALKEHTVIIEKTNRVSTIN